MGQRVYTQGFLSLGRLPTVTNESCLPVTYPGAGPLPGATVPASGPCNSHKAWSPLPIFGLSIVNVNSFLPWSKFEIIYVILVFVSRNCFASPFKSFHDENEICRSEALTSLVSNCFMSEAKSEKSCLSASQHLNSSRSIGRFSATQIIRRRLNIL